MISHWYIAFLSHGVAVSLQWKWCTWEKKRILLSAVGEAETAAQPIQTSNIRLIRPFFRVSIHLIFNEIIWFHAWTATPFLLFQIQIIIIGRSGRSRSSMITLISNIILIWELLLLIHRNLYSVQGRPTLIQLNSLQKSLLPADDESNSACL